MSRYDVGKQPCDNYRPSDSGFGTPNVHSCMYPFESADEPCCETHNGTVSFCENCNKDHHSDGYETCASDAKKAQEPR